MHARGIGAAEEVTGTNIILLSEGLGPFTLYSNCLYTRHKKLCNQTHEGGWGKYMYIASV